MFAVTAYDTVSVNRGLIRVEASKKKWNINKEQADTGFYKLMSIILISCKKV